MTVKKSGFKYLSFCAGLVATMVSSQASSVGVGVDASELIEAVTVDAVIEHMQAFQQIADENGGVREASGPGYFQSVLYVSEALSLAGYLVDVQVFPFTYFEDTTPPELQQIAPADVTYPPNDPAGFATTTYSGSGEVTATVEGVDLVLPPAPDANTSTSGCEPEDFAGFTAGNIALLQRGACTFFLKAFNAQEAGASGVIIFNEGQEGRTDAIGATLGSEGVTIPTVFSSFDIGNELASTESAVRLRVDALTEQRISANVLADTPVGNPEYTTVVGAHLDSVAAGPGIQDNGSGVGAILEIALQMSELGLFERELSVQNRIRFAFWGAEELGLLGSEYYVATLPDDEFEEITANLNFDMIGSPNYVRFVYDGDGSVSEQGGPEGSAFLEWLFNDYFQDQGLATAPTAFDGRSDYGPFIQAGIPAGGLFTGAEGIKTDEEAAIYGGSAGVAYDACYHEACDTIDNFSRQGLEEMTNAATYAVNVMAMNRLPVPSPVSSRSRFQNFGIRFDYDGAHATR